MWAMRKPAHLARTIVIGVVVGLVLLIVGLMPIPYYAQGPGPARDVVSRITYQGRPRYEPTGRLELTTVQYDQLTPLLALQAWLDDTLAIVPEDEVYPPDVPREIVEQRSTSQMDESKIAAMATVLRAIDEYPRGHARGALIERTIETCPADGELFPGDIVTAIDGTPIRSAAHASKVLDAIPDSQPLHFELDVDGRREEATFTREPCGGDDEPLVGVVMIDPFPFQATFSSEEIGGPSAGLMWALGLYELLEPGDLSAGRTIAGTGALDTEGTVYPIGGIRDKVVAAERAGASVFLVPAVNLSELDGVDTGDMRVIPVSSFAEAVEALETSGATG
jgi:PDZ domain-containing protein